MRLASLWIVLICVTGGVVFAQENSDSAIQTRIIALEKAWNQAYKAGDRRALSAILDDGIVLINDDGSTQTKAEFLATVTKTVNPQEQQVAPESMKVHVFGNVAIASGVFRAKGTEAESLMCGGNDLSIPGFPERASGCAWPRMQPRFCTEAYYLPLLNLLDR